MAQRVVIQKTDDIDGSEATQTITFALEGVSYEIDLNDAHADELRAAIKQYATAGRRIGGAGRPAPSAARRSASGYDPKAVRAWAAANSVEIPARGRIPGAVLEQYRAAGN